MERAALILTRTDVARARAAVVAPDQDLSTFGVIERQMAWAILRTDRANRLRGPLMHTPKDAA